MNLQVFYELLKHCQEKCYLQIQFLATNFYKTKSENGIHKKV
jgi:hypothetical protein